MTCTHDMHTHMHTCTHTHTPTGVCSNAFIPTAHLVSYPTSIGGRGHACWQARPRLRTALASPSYALDRPRPVGGHSFRSLTTSTRSEGLQWKYSVC